MVHCDCNLNFSEEGLATVDITTHEGHFQIPYIADTWNFILETAPSVDNCIVCPDYPAKAYF